MFAITRKVSPSIGRCELTHLERQPIDYRRAAAQHGQYEEVLRSAGLTVLSLDADPGLPDSVFVEDTAVVLDELAVITRPGAESRRAETKAVREALLPYRPLESISSPATVDGGDVLRVGQDLFVGITGRTTREGAAELERIVRPYGYVVTEVTVTGGLHLKTAVTEAGEGTVLLNPAWVDASVFSRFDRIEVDPAEPFAANALLVGESLIYPTSFPRTAARLQERGARLVMVDASELAKAEGGVTCCSLIVGD